MFILYEPPFPTILLSGSVYFLFSFPFTRYTNVPYWRNRQTLWGECTEANPKLLLNGT